MHAGSWITHHIWTCLLVNIIAFWSTSLYRRTGEQQEEYTHFSQSRVKVSFNKAFSMKHCGCAIPRDFRICIVMIYDWPWNVLKCKSKFMCARMGKVGLVVVLSSSAALSLMKTSGNERVKFLAHCQADEIFKEKKIRKTLNCLFDT